MSRFRRLDHNDYSKQHSINSNNIENMCNNEHRRSRKMKARNKKEAEDVIFQPVELVLPKKHKAKKVTAPDSCPNTDSNKLSHEHITISKCITRNCTGSTEGGTSGLDNEGSDLESESFETATNAEWEQNDRNRIESIGNIITSICNFFKNNPKTTKCVLIACFFYAVISCIEIIFPRLVVVVVRLLYPWSRYFSVIMEQFFSTISNSFTRLDALIHATYCEFATKYCRNHRLMCDVRCSFVDHVLSQSRPHLSPPYQN